MTQPLRILIVDDDPEICRLLATYLGGFGMVVETVGEGAAMRTLLADGCFDLLVLDLMLPGEDGLSLCREVRQRSDLPIIMLTARGESADRVLGLELGADDYVVKPFDPRELVARIHSLMRRLRAGQRLSSEPETLDAVRFAGWLLNRTTRELRSPAGLVIPLSNAEFRLLWTFIERPGRVLSRDFLLDAARGKAAEAFDRSIDLLVSRLRQKLEPDSREPQLIRTVRGEGYLLDARVQAERSAS